MAIIYSYPLNDNIKSLDELVGTTEKNINGQLKTVTRNFLLADLAEFLIVDGGLQKTIILTTDGTIGPATLDQVTGILNIPQYLGVTNLGYITSALNGIVTSSTGLDATLPLANSTIAGLLSPANFIVLSNTSGINTGDQNLQSVTDIGATTTNGISIDTEDTYEIGLYAISSNIGIKGESREAYGVYGTSPLVGVYGNSDNGYGVQGYSEAGIAVYGASQDNIGVQGNSILGTAVYAYSEYGTGLYATSESGVGVAAYSSSDIGLEVNGNGTIAIEANLGNSNKGLVINSGASSTGNFIELDKNGVDKLVVNQQGELTAQKLIKQGGTSSQILAADGSVITAGTNITIAGGTISSTGGGSQDLQSVTDIGATTTNTITANSIITTIDSTINGVTVGRGNISGTVSENTAVGYQALQSVIHTTGSTGYYNTAVGDKALKSLTTGYANDAFGDAALNLCTTGTFNLAIGSAAMLNSTTATQNSAIGQYALRDNLTGLGNTAVGLSALMQNTNSYNTAIGTRAGGTVSSTGQQNILIGHQAGQYVSSGRNNLLIENIDGSSITTGSYNIILNPKQKSGVTTGSNNTIIGCFDNTLSAGLTSNVIIGNGTGAIRFQSTDTGLTTVPAQTNTLINGDASGKAVVTKEYLTNSQSGFVPYTGATTDVNLGLNDITAAKLIKNGGFDYQFLKADGSVDNNTYLTSADLPSTLDLYATTSPDPVIAGYTALVRNIADSRYNTVAVDVPTPLVDGTLAAPTLCGAVISDPSILLGNPGVFNFSVIGKIRRTGGPTSSGADFFFSIYKRDISGVETKIADSSPVVVPANGGIYVEYISIALWNNGIFLSTDRIVLKFYGIQTGGGTGAYYEFLFGGTDPVRGTAAISSAIIPNIYLRDLADVEKVPAENNEILYWNDPASLWEHELAENLVPLATATQKGLVSTDTQTFAGDKTFTGTIGASNLSNTNTGDNATNTQYSGLATSKENALGDPSVNGYVLSSTTAGVRSWVAQTGGGGSQDLQSVTDEGSETTNSITAASFIKSEATSSQFLKGDGSVDTQINLSGNLGTVQSTTANTIAASYLWPTDIIAASPRKSFTIDLTVAKSLTTGTCQVRVYANSSVSLTGATLISTTSMTTTQNVANIIRHLLISGGASYVYYTPATSAFHDYLAFPWGVGECNLITNPYIIIALQNSVSTEVTTLARIKISSI